MSRKKPDFHDADLTLKLYELRREAVMRQSRDAINRDFWPSSYQDVEALADSKHPLNPAFRQVASYWEMVYGMAKHGIAHPDYLIENNAEGLVLYVKIEPYLEQFRREYIPGAFQNTEWITQNTEAGKAALERIRGRVNKMRERRVRGAAVKV